MKEPSKAPPEPLQRGLICSKCGCRHFEVIYTRASLGGRITRRRGCRHCGKRITTWEAPIGHGSPPRPGD